jgi:hypothetical protein
MTNRRNRTSLPQLAAKLRKMTIETPPGYRQLYMSVVDGRLPMIETENGRHYAPDDKLPEIAKLLGLTLREGIDGTEEQAA